MSNNYLLESIDSLSLSKKINELIEEHNFKESTISNYDLTENTLEQILEDLDTYSFLSSKKVIVVSNIEVYNKTKQEEDKKDIEHLLKYLDNSNPDNLFIIKSLKLDNSLKITKDLKKKMEYIKVEYTPESVVKEQLKGYKISKTDIDYLVTKCDNDITKIVNECDKLKNYCLESKNITKTDIDELVVKKLGEHMNLTFKFIEDLGKNNKKEALSDYEKLKEYGEEPISIVGLIASSLRTLLQIKVLEQDQYSKNEIAEQLHKKPFYIQKQQEITRLYSLKDLCKLIQNLEDIDMKMKTTDLDNNMLIESFIINI